MKVFLAILCILQLNSAFSQGYEWWNKAVNWDGETSWIRYINVAPATMGPNALPVADAETGLIVSETRLNIAAESHSAPGDLTSNLFTRLNLPLFSDRVSMNVHVVPIEYYVNDITTRNLRASRDKDGRGFSGGDIYVGTCIQLIRNHRVWPDIALSVNIKTASGLNFDAARYTDAPGYSFNTSFGKDISLGTHTTLRPFSRLGFFCYQTNREDYFQNDALLYGAGTLLTHKNISLQTSLDGYKGYINNGDHPLVLRNTISVKVHRTEYYLRWQEGFLDFPYTSFRMGCILRFGKDFLKPLMAVKTETLQNSAASQ